LEEADLAELLQAGPVSIAENTRYTLLLAPAADVDSAGTVWIASKCDMDLDSDEVLFSFGAGKWVGGKDAKSTMDDDLDAWYPFTITDSATRVLIDSKNLPTECSGLAGKLVEIGAAMQSVEANAGAINPALSHHAAQKTSTGPSP
jgi:hypothetical protein